MNAMTRRMPKARRADFMEEGNQTADFTEYNIPLESHRHPAVQADIEDQIRLDRTLIVDSHQGVSS